ncbi:MAG: restriction endonuclease subunit S, partial [Planctomycetes bacterium]|nr:restriction endonuclease subunit S [Planctomycetota bacterium]
AESDVGEIWIPKFKEQLVDRVVRACNALQSSESILNRLITAKREQKRGLMQQLLTGKLRFPGFTEPWKTVRLEEVVSLRNSKAVASEAPDLHCIELEHIEQGTGELIGRARAGSTVSLKTEFAPGDVLFGKLRPYLKKFALVDFAGFCSTEIWAITANRIAITSAYLRLLVESPAIQRAANATSGTKMPRADWDVVAATAVKLPPIVEQERITALTSTIEAELRLLNAQRAAFAAQRRGLMEKLLSGEIDIQNPKETAA